MKTFAVWQFKDTWKLGLVEDLAPDEEAALSEIATKLTTKRLPNVTEAQKWFVRYVQAFDATATVKKVDGIDFALAAGDVDVAPETKGRPKAYGGCKCVCHRREVTHMLPCCWPDVGAGEGTRKG